MATTKLGKVSITPKGDYVSGTAYDRLDTVYDAATNASYLSLKDENTDAVTVGTSWMLLCKGVGDGSGGSDNNFTDAYKATLDSVGLPSGIALLDENGKPVGARPNTWTPNAADVGASNPNLLINGDFKVWQRGTIFESINNVRTYTASRWVVDSDSQAKVSKEPGIFKITNQSAGTYANIQQLIEPDDFEILKGKTITAQIKLKISNLIQQMWIYNSEGTEYYGSEFFTEPSDYFTATFNIPANAPSGMLSFGFQMKTDTIGNALEVEYVKLEIGSIATPFVPRSYAEELALCQRYYEDSNYNFPLVSAADGVFNLVFPYSVKKRIPPTVVIYSMSGTPNKISYYSNGWVDTDYVDFESRSGGYRLGHFATVSGDTHPVFAWTYTADAEIY